MWTVCPYISRRSFSCSSACLFAVIPLCSPVMTPFPPFCWPPIGSSGSAILFHIDQAQLPQLLHTGQGLGCMQVAASLLPPSLFSRVAPNCAVAGHSFLLSAELLVYPYWISCWSSCWPIPTAILNSSLAPQVCQLVSPQPGVICKAFEEALHNLFQITDGNA